MDKATEDYANALLRDHLKHELPDAEFKQFAKFCRKASHDLIKHTLKEVRGVAKAAEKAKQAGAEPTALLPRIYRVYHRKLGEQHRLFPVFELFETSYRSFLALWLETHYRQRVWWDDPYQWLRQGKRATDLRAFHGTAVSFGVTKATATLLYNVDGGILTGDVVPTDLHGPTGGAGRPAGATHEGFDVGAALAFHGLGELRQVRAREVASKMEAQDLRPRARIRQGNCDLPVETTGPADRRVDQVRMVRGADDDDARPSLGAVEALEEAVDDFPGVPRVVVVDVGPVAERVELVDEQDARSGREPSAQASRIGAPTRTDRPGCSPRARASMSATTPRRRSSSS